MSLLVGTRLLLLGEDGKPVLTDYAAGLAESQGTPQWLVIYDALFWLVDTGALSVDDYDAVYCYVRMCPPEEEHDRPFYVSMTRQPSDGKFQHRQFMLKHSSSGT